MISAPFAIDRSFHPIPFARTALALGLAAALAACGGGESTPPAVKPPAPITGVLLDSAVQGVSYSTATQTGVTDADGQFKCMVGETVSFNLGAIQLGSAACAPAITPLHLAGSTNPDADEVVNRLHLLQALDEDDNPSNGIQIPESVSKPLARGLDFKLNAVAFSAALHAVLPSTQDAYGAPYQSRTNAEERRQLAREHFSGTLARLGLASATRTFKGTPAGDVQVVSHTVSAPAAFNVAYIGSQASVKADFPKGFATAVGSGLAFKGLAADGSLEFWGITDRGPNGDAPKLSQVVDGVAYTSAKIFPAPDFTPSLATIKVGKDGAVVQSLLPLMAGPGTRMLGRPLPLGSNGSSGELPLNDQLVYDVAKGLTPHGIDPESVVIDTARKALWVSDEYGPFIAKVDPASGIIQKTYKPGTSAGDLPAVFSKRRANRGMEGLALDTASGVLHGFLQSPLDDGSVTDAQDLDQDGKKDDKVNVRDFAQFVRWLAFDPSTETSRVYAYPAHFPLAGQTWDRNRTGSIKLGDMVSIAPGKFAVIEQGADSKGVVRNFIMLVEVPTGVTNLAAIGSELEKNSIDVTTRAAIPWKDVVPLKKTLLLDLNALGWVAEKAEGLTLVDGQTLALINDNDFGVRTVLENASGKRVAGSVEDCTVSTTGVLSGCGDATTARVTRGLDRERQTRLWLIKLPSALSSYPKSGG